jgi:hypothetical protein
MTTDTDTEAPVFDLPPGYEPPSPTESVDEEAEADESQPQLSLEDRAQRYVEGWGVDENDISPLHIEAWVAGYDEGFKEGFKSKKQRKIGAPTGKGKRLTSKDRDPARLDVYTNEIPFHSPGDVFFSGEYRARIGYGKLGRTIDLDPDDWGQNGGDNEPPLLLNKLALRNPDVEFVIIGKNSGEVPQDVGFPANVTNPWTEWKPALAERLKGGKASDRQFAQDTLDEVTLETFMGLDGMIIWAGQHGTSNSRIPTVSDRTVYTEPQISFIHYASFLIRGINAWREVDPISREEVWLVPDARNYIKARDLQWPTRHKLLCQFDFTRPDKLERYTEKGSPADYGFASAYQVAEGVWQAPYNYKYARLEMVGIPSDTEFRDDDYAERSSFGIVINEARNYVKHDRLTAMQDYVLPLDPAFIYGRWTPNSLKVLGRDIEPLHYSKVAQTIRTTRTTLTTPSSGSGWATTKAWESFAAGVVCFFHPQYDTQGHIIPTLEQVERGDVDDLPELKALATWLRVRNPEDLQKRIAHMDNSEETWKWIVGAQRRLYDAAREDAACIVEIEDRIGVKV